MKLLDLTCNHCGARLDVPHRVRFLTCSFCGTQLKVEQSGGAVYTEALEEIAQDIKDIKRDASLNRLDREWEMRRDSLMVRDKHGRVSVPTRTGSLVGGVLMAAFGVFFIVTAASIGAGGFFALFGVAFVAFVVFGAARSWSAAGTYEREHADYERARLDLMSNDS